MFILVMVEEIEKLGAWSGKDWVSIVFLVANLLGHLMQYSLSNSNEVNGLVFIFHFHFAISFVVCYKIHIIFFWHSGMFLGCDASASAK